MTRDDQIKPQTCRCQTRETVLDFIFQKIFSFLYTRPVQDLGSNCRDWFLICRIRMLELEQSACTVGGEFEGQLPCDH